MRASDWTSRCLSNTVAWLRAAATGDLGYSIQRNGMKVLALVLERIGPTVLLMAAGLAIAIVVGIAAGILSAVRRNSVD